MKTNDWREQLLDDARRYSPISSVFHLRKLPRTVIYRMFAYPIVWVLISVYAAAATLTRLGIVDLGQLAAEEGGIPRDEFDSAGVYDGAEVLVVFSVVFYLGYCYNRHFEIYQLASQVKSMIINLCAASRACLPKTTARKLFVHLNLMHCSAYCALSPIYNKENFMDVFCKLHHITLPNHEEFFGDVDTAGGVHYSQCAVWAQSALYKALKRGDIHAEAFRTMQEEILRLRSTLNSIFAYQYQVIPFAYSHLVSAACFFYLVGLALVKAMRFHPDAPVLAGLVLPMLSFWIALITTIGLIDIGQAISDPWGNDPEDFAVPRFLHSTAKMSRYLIESANDDPLEGDQQMNIGTPELSHIPVDGQSRLVRRRMAFPPHMIAMEDSLEEESVRQQPRPKFGRRRASCARAAQAAWQKVIDDEVKDRIDNHAAAKLQHAIRASVARRSRVSVHDTDDAYAWEAEQIDEEEQTGGGGGAWGAGRDAQPGAACSRAGGASVVQSRAMAAIPRMSSALLEA
jgi:predicted membrane chloride channel (bestrophin family)